MVGKDSNNNDMPQSKPISLTPLTPDQALAAALNVKKSDVDKLSEAQKKAKAKARKPKKRSSPG